MTQHTRGVNSPLWDPICWLTCLGLGLAGCLLLQSAAGWSLTHTILMSSLALAAALWTSAHCNRYRQAARHSSHAGDPIILPEQTITGLELVCQKAVPIWAQQIEVSRSQTEDAMIDLTERFSGLASKLELAVNASQLAAGDLAGSDSSGMAAVLNESQVQLNAVIAIMHSAQANRDAMLAEIKCLTAYTVELNNMALDVA